MQPDPEVEDSKESSKTVEPDRAYIVGGHRDDAVIEVEVSADEMLAMADFHPPIGVGAPLTPDYVRAVIDRLGIVYGIDWEAIDTATVECNLERHIVHHVAIAKGSPSVDAEDPYFQLEDQFKIWPPIPNGEIPRIDYREISPFLLVRKGTVVARRTEAKIGADGTTIRGILLPHTTKKNQGIQAGPNTREVGDTIEAAADGRLVRNDKLLAVEETLVIKGMIGYGTGHVIFPGDVVIEGQVADGFKIYAGGSILAKETLDATEVSAKKDIIVAGGIVGRGRGVIKTGGDIRTKFMQNCKAACRGSVYAAGAILNCSIYAMGRVDLGDKGRLVGGETYAIKGLRAAALGNESQIGTRLHCGVDFAVQQEIDRLNEKLRILTLRAKNLKDREARNDHVQDDAEIKPSTEEEAYQLLRKLEQAVAGLSRRIATLLPKLNAVPDARVEVSGTVHPGTVIEICHVALFIAEPLKRVRFFLNADRGVIAHDRL